MGGVYGLPSVAEREAAFRSGGSAASMPCRPGPRRRQTSPKPSLSLQRLPNSRYLRSLPCLAGRCPGTFGAAVPAMLQCRHRHRWAKRHLVMGLGLDDIFGVVVDFEVGVDAVAAVAAFLVTRG